MSYESKQNAATVYNNGNTIPKIALNIGKRRFLSGKILTSECEPVLTIALISITTQILITITLDIFNTNVIVAPQHLYF